MNFRTKKIWNLLQQGRGSLRLRPLGCQSDRSPSFCSGCEPGHYFECETCGYLQPWCKGADDGYFAICDDCWAITQQMHEAASLPMEQS
jgi:hypothetical protein